MRVLFLQRQPCARARKVAAALRSALPDIELGFAYGRKSLTEFYGQGDESFDRLWNIGVDGAGLGSVVAEYEPDVIHSHNLPDNFTVQANELVAGRLPVVHDVHDLQSLRQTPYEDGVPEPANSLELERRALEESASVVTVSPELMDVLRRRYHLPELTLVFPSYALGAELPRAVPGDEQSVEPRLVYQGTLSANGGHYDLRTIFEAAIDEGFDVDVYPNRVVGEYRELADRLPGLTVHEPRSPAQMLRELPRYDFGWAGFNAELNGAHLDTALPNKVFEYLACGLPVVAFPHRAIRRLLVDEGVGIVVTRARDLDVELLRSNVAELRRRVVAARSRFTVEANIHGLVNLYRELTTTGVSSAMSSSAVP
jgi:glycosyltransferase involved in cell wall biosynthesis